MSRRLAYALAVLVVVLAVAAPARADEIPPAPDLTVGMEAPPLDVAHWVKGVEMDRRGAFTPLTTFQPGTVYVVEFWATWCGPCRAGMPHLSALQEEYAEKGVKVIGISDETLPKVVEFLWTQDRDGRIQNDRTKYTLATDPDRSVYAAYMTAAGQSGIPTAFLVGKDGHIEWIGHPMRLDEPLAKVLAGDWDREAARKEFEEGWRAKMAMQRARAKLAAAAQAGDWPGVLAIYDELLAQTPDSTTLLLQKLDVLMKRMDDEDQAYALVGRIAKASWDDAPMLNRVAWMIADDKEVRHRRLSVALELAERAYSLTDGKDASILDTLARVHFEMALGIQRAAVEMAEGALQDQLRQVLERYEGAAPK